MTVDPLCNGTYAIGQALQNAPGNRRCARAMRDYCSGLIASLSSPPTHDELVADILWDSGDLHEQVVEVRREGEEFTTTIFPRAMGSLGNSRWRNYRGRSNVQVAPWPHRLGP